MFFYIVPLVWIYNLVSFCFEIIYYITINLIFTKNKWQ